MEKYYPEHCAIILDGNRRWAKRQGLPQLKGHLAGFENIKVFGDFTFESPKEDAERIFFACKK